MTLPDMAGPFCPRSSRQDSALFPSVDASRMTMSEHLATVRERALAALKYDDEGSHVLDIISRALLEHRESMFLNSKCLLMMSAISAGDINSRADIWEWIEQFQPPPPTSEFAFTVAAVD